MNMYYDGGGFPRERLEEARASYRNLKDGLRAGMSVTPQRGEAELTVAERRWYQRPVHQAMTQLREPIDATPENWGSGLYSAYSAFSSELDRMNEVYDIPKEWMQWKEPMH